MLWIIGISAALIMFIIFQNLKNNKQDIKSAFQVIKPVQSAAASEAEQTILGSLANKIDLKKEHPIFSHNQVRLKCIRAGIRGAAQQKMIILMRYLLIAPVSLVSTFMVYSFATKDMKLIFITLICGAILGYFLPVIRLDSMKDDRQIELNNAFPDFIDIMMVCVGAGMTAEQAYFKISNDMGKFSRVMASEIEILSSELTYFLEPKTAYDNFYQRTENEYIKAYVSIILQSIQFGTPLTSGLRALSLEVREKQMGNIEKKAASLPSKLTLPMMIFTIPVLFVVIGFPAGYQVMQTM